MTRGIDCARPLDGKTALAIKRAGYDFAGRYLVPAVGTLAWKALTKTEAEVITGAGLRLLTVWETTADRVKGGAAAGTSDGKRALQCAVDIGMPTSGIIYFAVDYDATAADMPIVEAYLRAARAQTGDYEIGVYGSYKVIEYMAARDVCKAYWQCVGWSGGKISANHNVYQAKWGQTVAGVSVDINDCPDMSRAGIWNYEEEENMQRYNTMAEIEKAAPWAVEKVQRLIQAGKLNGKSGQKDAKGNPTGLDLSEDMLRIIAMLG